MTIFLFNSKTMRYRVELSMTGRASNFPRPCEELKMESGKWKIVTVYYYSELDSKSISFIGIDRCWVKLSMTGRASNSPRPLRERVPERRVRGCLISPSSELRSPAWLLALNGNSKFCKETVSLAKLSSLCSQSASPLKGEGTCYLNQTQRYTRTLICRTHQSRRSLL